MADIDWTAVELDYRAGVLPVSAIAKKHGTTDARIKGHAERFGWERKPLDVFAINAAHGVASSPSAAKFGMDSDLTATDVQKAAVLQAAAVLDIHRKDVRKLRELSGKFSDALSELFAQFTNSPPTDAAGALQTSMLVLGALLGDKTPIDLLESLSRVMVRLVQIERQAYGLDVLPLDPNKAGEASEQMQNKVNELWSQVQQIQKDKVVQPDESTRH